MNGSNIMGRSYSPGYTYSYKYRNQNITISLFLGILPPKKAPKKDKKIPKNGDKKIHFIILTLH